MANLKRYGLILTFLIFKIVQSGLIYGILTSDLKGKLSNLDKAAYIVPLMAYCFFIMLPLIALKTKTAMKWEIFFSAPTNLIYFAHAYGRFHNFNIQKSKELLNNDEVEELLQNTLENKDEIASKNLLELYSFILEVAILVLALVVYFKKKISKFDQLSLAVNISNRDLEQVSNVEVQVNEPPAGEPLSVVEPLSSTEPFLAVKPAAADIPSPAVDASQLKEKLEGLMNQAVALEISLLPSSEYRRRPYQIPIEEEDEYLETQV